MSITSNHFTSNLIPYEPLAEYRKKKLLMKNITDTINEYGFQLDGQFLSKHATLNDGNLTIVPISNFICWPSREFKVQGPHQTTFEYEVEGVFLKDYRPLPPIRLTIKQLKTADWVQQHWGLDPRVEPKMYAHLYEVFHHLRESRIHATIINETGWHKLDNAWYYIHAGGAIGKSQPTEEIHCNLAWAKFARYSLPDSCPDIQKAATAMLDVLKIGNPCMAYPLATIIWIPPLAEIFRQNGTPLDFAPYIKGPTACGKSVTAGFALSAYGNMDKHSFPASFRDTVASTEQTFATLKDALCVIDDYHPRSPSEQRSMDALADSIVRMVADGNVRNRFKQDSPRPQAFVVATGETIPSIAASGLSRYLFIECNAHDLYYAGKFSEVSSNAPLLREFMYAYISWIATNWDRVSSMLVNAYENHLKHFAAIGEGRTVNAVAKMGSALEIGLTFFRELGLLDEQGLRDHLDIGRTVLEALLRSNLEIQAAVSPADSFLTGLQNAVNCGQAVLVPLEFDRLPPRGIGGFDKTHIYLLPAKAYDRVSRFLSSRNQQGLLEPKDVWKALEAKKLLTWNSTRKRHTQQKRLPFMGGKNIEVLVIDRKHVPELSL